MAISQPTVSNLTEQQRGQLDGIVKQMIANGESDANIQADPS